MKNRTELSQKYFHKLGTFEIVRNEAQVRAFAIRLRELRKERNWSQQELALEAEISLKTVQRLERAEYTGTLDILFSIAKAFELDPGDLLKELGIKKMER